MKINDVAFFFLDSQKPRIKNLEIFSKSFPFIYFLNDGNFTQNEVNTYLTGIKSSIFSDYLLSGLDFPPSMICWMVLDECEEADLNNLDFSAISVLYKFSKITGVSRAKKISGFMVNFSRVLFVEEADKLKLPENVK